MSRLHNFGTLVLLAFTLGAARGQDSTQSTSGSDTGGNYQEPVAAYGQENPPAPISQNPPLSGMDVPGLEPHAAPVSYLQAGATLAETADSNVANTLGSGSTSSISRALASLTLQRLWSHYDLGLDYVGGTGYYDLKGEGFKALQQMDLEQKITWKRGQLALRDSFSYLPEGNFGGSYGSLGSQGIESLGNSPFGTLWGGAALGTLGLAPRIVNVSLADISENLTPRSSVTAAGGYAFTHFYGNDFSTGAPFLGSSQVSAQAGYDRILTSHTQMAFVYGYQGFDFKVIGADFHSHIIEVLYGHRLSGRMDFIAGAGPQFTHIELFGIIPDFRIGVAGQARLRYRFPKTSLDLSYQRFLTSGSGFFLGAETDIARMTLSRPLSRVWSAFADLGYSRNSRQQPLTAQELTTCGAANQPPCPGVNANTYEYGFAGGGLHRAFGHDFHAYISYQFNELSFDHSYCGGLPVCSRIGNRQAGTIGLDWTPRPIRLD